MPPGSGIDVVFDDALRAHPSLSEGLGNAESFVRNPGSPLVAPLSDHAADEARYVYATDAPLTLAEILDLQRSRNRPCGSTAALQIMRGVARALGDVEARARAVGLRSHGNLNPWRIAIRRDGTPVLLGYGLPDTELFAYLDEEQPGVSLDTLRYAPPERLDDHDEDARSDLYTLAIIGAEMLLGRPVFDGTPTSIAERVIRGDAPELIEALGADLGEAMLDLLCVATEHAPDERFRDITEFLQQARALQGTGPDLRDLVQQALDARPSPVAADAPAAPEQVATPDEPEDEGMGLIAPVPPLAANADLEAIRSYARSLVARTDQLTQQAHAMQNIAEQRAQNLPAVRPLLRRLKDAVGRAEKASTSTTSTARLVELDDEAADARITLEMVRSAEKLCESATQAALDLLDAVQSEVDEARAENELLERARRLADAAATRAEAASEVAKGVLESLRGAAEDGALDSPESALEQASEHTRVAEEAARRARSTHHTTTRQSRGADAMRDADKARGHAETAEAAATALQRLEKELAEARRDALDVLRAAIRSGVARAQSAALSAKQSLQRATDATADADLPSLSARLKAIRKLVERAEEAAAKSLDASGILEAPPVLRDLRAALEVVDAQASEATTHASDADAQSDHVVSKAGEAARQAALVSKLRNEAQALLTRLEAAHTEVDTSWSALRTDTAEVTGTIARDAVQVAQRASLKVAEMASEVRARCVGLDANDDTTFLQERVHDLTDAVADIEDRAERALSRCREARGAASRELDEIAERHRQERELQDAIDHAVELADHCKKAVDEAWSAYHDTTALLAAASVDGLEDLRVRAYEVIDIAEFQAGEAAVAASAAGEQREVSEARSHASTAASFKERITEDLPEALQLLEQIRVQASAELEALQSARKEASAALDEGRQAVRAIEEMKVSGREAARDWVEDASVANALQRLLERTTGLDAPLDVLQRADDDARAAEAAADAQTLLPQAATSLRTLLQARRDLEGLSTALDAAVTEARAEIETRENATRSITSALETVRLLEQKLSERAARLYEAIEQHQATGETVRKARKRMRKAIDATGEAHDFVARSARQVLDVPTAAAAHQLQVDVEARLSKVETVLEAAAEAETQGVAAAERESADRVEAESRRLTHARRSSLSHLATASAAAAKCVDHMHQVRTALRHHDDPVIAQARRAATTHVQEARQAATDALRSARQCQRADTADEAMAFEVEVAARAADAHTAAGQAKALIQEARDHARKQEEAAAALENIKAEVGSIAEGLAETVETAQRHAAEVVETTAGSQDPDTLATVTEAEELVGAVKHAAAKVTAAAPMALDSTDVTVAQGLLNTCRHARERMDGGVDALRELIQKAGTLLSQEAERAANRLSEAREAAERPAQEARALSERAAAWVEAGERAAEGYTSPEVEEALARLREKAIVVADEARQTEEAAAPARTVETVEEAGEIGVLVRQAADRTLEAAESTRAQLDDLRSACEQAAELDREAQQFRLRAAEAAAAAEICASEANATAEALEKALSDSGVTDDDVATAFREVKRTAKSITTAAASAFSKTEATVQLRSLEEVGEAAKAVETHREEAQELLTELQRQDRACRELLEGVKRRSREADKRSKDEALRARLRKKRNQSTIMKREELKKQFLAEKEPSEVKPNLSKLRERLRSRRRPEPPNRLPKDGPSRMGDRPRRRRPAADGPSRMPPTRRQPESPAEEAPRTLRRPATRRRPEPDDSSRLRNEPDESSRLMPVENPSNTLSTTGMRQRTSEEREASRRRRLERRRQRTGHTDARPRVSTSRAPEPDLGPPEKTEIGILAPDDLQEADENPRQGADALLRRLRRRRDD